MSPWLVAFNVVVFVAVFYAFLDKEEVERIMNETEDPVLLALDRARLFVKYRLVLIPMHRLKWNLIIAVNNVKIFVCKLKIGRLKAQLAANEKRLLKLKRRLDT